MVELIGTLLPLLSVVVGAVAGAAKGIVFVREGERALLLRFEKARKRKNGEYLVVEPGFKVIIPWIERFARMHVRQRVINLAAQTIVLNDSTVFSVSAVITARVKDTSRDVYNALFETTGVNQALSDFGLTVVREELTGKNYSNLFGEGRAIIDQALQQKLQDKVSEWGIQVLSFQLSDCEPSDETARMIQTKAAMRFKYDGLLQLATSLGLESVRDLQPALVAGMTGVQMVVTVPSVAVAESPDSAKK